MAGRQLPWQFMLRSDNVRRSSAATARANPPVETGPIRFGNDKTGIFIRADNALGFSMALRSPLDSPASAGLGGSMENADGDSAAAVGIQPGGSKRP